MFRLKRWLGHVVKGIRFILAGLLLRLLDNLFPHFHPTAKMEDDLTKQRIKFVGKQVQCSLDRITDDEYGRGICYDVDIRVPVNTAEVEYAYFIQDSTGTRYCSLNARIVG
jgi:hypothetical protein